MFVVQCLVCRLLEHCQRYVASKQSNLTQWHPILGWFSSNDKCSALFDVQETTPLVKQQLGLLWSGMLANQLMECLPLAERDENNLFNPRMESQEEKNLVATFRKVLSERKTSKSNQSVKVLRKIGSPEVTRVALVFTMFQTALSTLTQMRMDILTGNVSVFVTISH